MYERLLENWLDNASERSYQAPFCQMLSAQGHTILHSTRHRPIEFGKDVLTVAPDGIPCAYQLKGNPSGHLTLQQFREIQAQLFELAVHPLAHPGLPRVRHRAFLVTNGEVEEEARLSLREMNRRIAESGAPPVELIARGQLLGWARDLGANLWPSELRDISDLLNVLVADGTDQLPFEIFHRLLADTLSLREESPAVKGAAELRRSIASAGILTAVALKNFYERRNHVAIVAGWTLFAAYAIGACARNKKSFRRNGAAAVAIAEEAAVLSLSDLCSELTERDDLIEGDPMVDFVFYRARLTLVASLMCAYWFRSRTSGWPQEGHEAFVESFIPKGLDEFHLWGEGAIPQLLAFHWYRRAKDATPAPDGMLVSLLNTVVASALGKGAKRLASPYFTLEDVMQHELRPLLPHLDDPLGEESETRRSFFAEGLLHLLVRTNFKSPCQTAWPDFSRLSLQRFIPEKEWQYVLWRTTAGRERTVQPPFEKRWEDLKTDARDVAGGGIPSALKQRPWLLFLFVIFLPFRATPDAIRFLGRQFNETWFIAPPIPCSADAQD